MSTRDTGMLPQSPSPNVAWHKSLTPVGLLLYSCSCTAPVQFAFLANHCELPAGPASGDVAPKKRCALGTLPAGEARGNRANVQASLSVLAMPQGVDGTLLDLINAHKAADKPIGDALVLYIALQMLLVRSNPLLEQIHLAAGHPVPGCVLIPTPCGLTSACAHIYNQKR